MNKPNTNNKERSWEEFPDYAFSTDKWKNEIIIRVKSLLAETKRKTVNEIKDRIMKKIYSAGGIGGLRHLEEIINEASINLLEDNKE